MEIKLRNIYVSGRVNKEIFSFDADLYINNKMVGTAANKGLGEETTYKEGGERGRRLISEAEKFCKDLPPKVYGDITHDGKPITAEMSLGGYIDGQVMAFMERNFLAHLQRKMEKDMPHYILYGIPGEKYRMLRCGGPLEDIFQHKSFLPSLRDHIHRHVLDVLEPGEKILNTNIPAGMIIALGIPFDKIVGVKPGIAEDKKNGMFFKKRGKRNGF